MTSDHTASSPNRIALVTGASRGLGAATARRLATAGYDVVLTYRREVDEADRVADAVRAAGRQAWAYRCDLGDLADVEALFDAVETDAGGLDVLVANAAATSFRPLLDAKPHHVEKTFAISVTGFLRCVQRAVPLFEARGGGRVVAVSGADTLTYIPAHGLLGAAKAAMETMVKYLACELGERNVTVVGVAPGWIDTDSIRLMLGDFYEEGLRIERETHPLRTAATPDDIAEVVVLLCGDAARWVSGTTVVADGAGVFAFCGRYTTVGAELALARATAASAAGPVVPAPPTADGPDHGAGDAGTAP